MSMDTLQEKIRKKKNPLMLDLTIVPEELPPHLLTEAGSSAAALGRFCHELLLGLKPLVPAVRFSFAAFALLGPEGLQALSSALKEADTMGYYVLLDAPEFSSPKMAEYGAKTILGEGSRYPCDGLLISVYAGSDMIKPFLPYITEGKKDIFGIVRTANRSASEVQDLLSGTRLVYAAAAERVVRYSAGTAGKYGFCRAGLLTAASSPESIRFLRSRFSEMFLLMDGLDYSGANMKNCALGFDKLGRGGVICAGEMVSGAWKQAESDGTDYVQHAVAAAEKIRKNAARYTSIL